MIRILTFALALTLPTLAVAADFDQTHGLFGQILKTHVQDGLVDYAALKADRGRLDTYVAALGAVSQESFASWGRDDRFAFWINAYNAFTLKVIIDNYPIEGSWFSLYPRNSIRQISGVWDKIKFTAVGRKITLNDIEHQVLRKEFKDPRLHGAINCASASCPELRNEPYLADRLNEQLDDAARRFARDTFRNRVDVESKTLHASEIFKWFYKDFLSAYAPDGSFAGLSGKEAAAGSFMARFADEGSASAIKAGGFDVEWLSYDWELNDIPRSK